MKAFEAAEGSSQLALEATQLGYKVGVRVNIDVLNAQTQLFQTRRDLARARYDVLVDSLRLRQASGVLAPADLQQINGLLAPERRLRRSPVSFRASTRNPGFRQPAGCRIESGMTSRRCPLARTRCGGCANPPALRPVAERLHRRASASACFVQ